MHVQLKYVVLRTKIKYLGEEAICEHYKNKCYLHPLGRPTMTSLKVHWRQNWFNFEILESEVKETHSFAPLVQRPAGYIYG